MMGKSKIYAIALILLLYVQSILGVSQKLTDQHDYVCVNHRGKGHLHRLYKARREFRTHHTRWLIVRLQLAKILVYVMVSTHRYLVIKR